MNESQANMEIEHIQSTQYQFPYHYIPSVEGFPNFSKSWSFSPSYIAAITLVRDWLKGLSIKESHKHMDFGCGDGGFVNALLQLKDLPHIHFEGIDFDESAIRWAKIFSKEPNSFSSGDIGKLPPETYDSGTLIEVFEHIPPDLGKQFVEMLGKALKKGAPLFVTVPSVEKPVREKHYRHFDFETLQDCFSEVFDVEDIYGFEKESFLQRLVTWFSYHWRWRFESRLTNQFLISQFASKHRNIKGCGRIAMVLKRK